MVARVEPRESTTITRPSEAVKKTRDFASIGLYVVTAHAKVLPYYIFNKSFPVVLRASRSSYACAPSFRS
jgi:hypothetical protein